MKSTGLLRKIGRFGHFVIPMELRHSMGINENDSIEFFTEKDKIIFRKYKPACIFCENTSNIKEYNDKLICQDCIKAAYDKTKAI